MTEEIGLVVRVNIKPDPDSMKKLEDDSALAVKKGIERGSQEAKPKYVKPKYTPETPSQPTSTPVIRTDPGAREIIRETQKQTSMLRKTIEGLSRAFGGLKGDRRGVGSLVPNIRPYPKHIAKEMGGSASASFDAFADVIYMGNAFKRDKRDKSGRVQIKKVIEALKHEYRHAGQAYGLSGEEWKRSLVGASVDANEYFKVHPIEFDASAEERHTNGYYKYMTLKQQQKLGQLGTQVLPRHSGDAAKIRKNRALTEGPLPDWAEKQRQEGVYDKKYYKMARKMEEAAWTLANEERNPGLDMLEELFPGDDDDSLDNYSEWDADFYQKRAHYRNQRKHLKKDRRGVGSALPIPGGKGGKRGMGVAGKTSKATKSLREIVSNIREGTFTPEAQASKHSQEVEELRQLAEAAKAEYDAASGAERKNAKRRWETRQYNYEVAAGLPLSGAGHSKEKSKNRQKEAREKRAEKKAREKTEKLVGKEAERLEKGEHERRANYMSMEDPNPGQPFASSVDGPKGKPAALNYANKYWGDLAAQLGGKESALNLRAKAFRKIRAIYPEGRSITAKPGEQYVPKDMQQMPDREYPADGPIWRFKRGKKAGQRKWSVDTGPKTDEEIKEQGAREVLHGRRMGYLTKSATLNYDPTAPGAEEHEALKALKKKERNKLLEEKFIKNQSFTMPLVKKQMKEMYEWRANYQQGVIDNARQGLPPPVMEMPETPHLDVYTKILRKNRKGLNNLNLAQKGLNLPGLEAEDPVGDYIKQKRAAEKRSKIYDEWAIDMGITQPEVKPQMGKGGQALQGIMKGLGLDKVLGFMGIPGLGGGGGGGPPGMGGMGGKGGMKGMMAGGAVAGAAAAGIMIVVDIMKKMLEVLIQFFKFVLNASPAWNAGMKAIQKILEVTLMPIGNMLFTILRPLIMKYAGRAAQNAQDTMAAVEAGDVQGAVGPSIGLFGEMMGELIEAMLPAFIDTAVEMIKTFPWLTLLGAIGDTMTKIITEAMINIFSFLATLPLRLIDMLLGTNLADQCGSFLNNLLGGLYDAIWDGADVLGQLAGQLGEMIRDALWSGIDAIIGFGEWLWEAITGAIGSVGNWLGGFGSWLWNSITGAFSNLGSILSGFGDWLWNMITGWLGGAGDFIGNVGNDVGNFFGNIWPFAEGGIVTSPTMGLVGEAGPEAIIPLSRFSELMGSGGSGDVRIEVNISGNIYGVSDLNSAMEEAADRYLSRIRGY